MRYMVVALLVAVGVYGLHRILTFAAVRGWVYYRNSPRRGHDLGLAAPVFQPAIEHVIEARWTEAIIAEVDEQGGPPPGR